MNFVVVNYNSPNHKRSRVQSWDHSRTGTTGSNLAQVIERLPYLPVSCCPGMCSTKCRKY